MTDDKKILTVSETVWPWKDSKRKVRPDEAEHRKKMSVIEACVALTFGSILMFVFHHRVMGGIVMCIGTTVLIGGHFVPPIDLVSLS